ncbi:hypothetical protein [Sediminicola luteus]|nr:hypothetical protein [Sediminicola luteus]
MDMDSRNSKVDKIRQIISNFEDGKITVDVAVSQINIIGYHQISEDYLQSYWESENIDDFIGKIITEPIQDWQKIDDNQALLLLKELIENIVDDAIFERNSEALEKRYAKSSGSINNWLFHDNIMEPKEILKMLTHEDRIIL